MKLDDSRGAGALRDEDNDVVLYSSTTTRSKAESTASACGVVTTANVGVEQLAALLATKENELRVLQKTHDEYVRSSCEYEKELEGEVERVEKKLHAMEIQVHALEEAKRHLQSTHSQTHTELLTTRKREEVLLSLVEEMKWKIQRLEQSNDELETATRVAEASIDELQHKVETLTEENVFLQQEKEEEDPTDVPSPGSASTKRRSMRAFPEVVESCLHITCQCNRSAPSAPPLAPLPVQQQTKNVPKKAGFLSRLRRCLSLS